MMIQNPPLTGGICHYYIHMSDKTYTVCGEIDSLSGAICGLEAGHRRSHLDNSSEGIQYTWHTISSRAKVRFSDEDDEDLIQAYSWWYQVLGEPVPD